MNTEELKKLAEARVFLTAKQICREVAELGDRNSPTDWPEAMLVTHEELHGIVTAALQEHRPPPSASGDVVELMRASPAKPEPFWIARIAAGGAPRLRNPGESVEDYRVAMGWDAAPAPAYDAVREAFETVNGERGEALPNWHWDLSYRDFRLGWLWAEANAHYIAAANPAKILELLATIDTLTAQRDAAVSGLNLLRANSSLSMHQLEIIDAAIAASEGGKAPCQ